jgi:hypothetical protein
MQVAKVPSLERYRLYLVDWGYNTEAERSRAAASPRIEIIGIKHFQELARAGAAQATRTKA